MTHPRIEPVKIGPGKYQIGDLRVEFERDSGIGGYDITYYTPIGNAYQVFLTDNILRALGKSGISLRSDYISTEDLSAELAKRGIET